MKPYKLMKWLRVLISGKPHFVIGSPGSPYLLRWYVIPRNRWMNVYLHKIVRDDDDRALHDHPWWFASLVLRGGYRELIRHGNSLTGMIDPHQTIERRPGSVAIRTTNEAHRVELFRDAGGKPIPSWTLVFTGRKVREWGFWCSGKGFVVWTDFVSQSDHGNIGKGCGD